MTHEEVFALFGNAIIAGLVLGLIVAAFNSWRA